ncbi:DUF4865 family protein [Dickeya zeae]|nr:DUF4865 family protein [Dickeya zeae]MCO7260355.1 DUF4865 family protein [Dickeya zeae]
MMIVMQYSFVLPADYDMETIEQRIARNGAKLDGFAGLLFKAYLYAKRHDPDIPSVANLYAPLYVWKHSQGMAAFLQSPGFAALTRDFGWPQIDCWLAGKIPQPSEVKAGAIAQRVITPIPPYSHLPDWLSGDAQAMLTAWDVSHWRQLQMDFLPLPAAATTVDDSTQRYRIGYVAC